MATPITTEEMAEILWENYYTLLNTPVSAIRNIWDEMEAGSLYPWVRDEYGISLSGLLDAICSLSRFVTEESMNRMAIESLPHAPKSRRKHRVGR